MSTYYENIWAIQSPHNRCKTQDYKLGFSDALLVAAEIAHHADVEITNLRAMLTRITTAKDIAMPIETDEAIKTVLNGSAQKTQLAVLIEESNLLRAIGKALASRYLYEGHPVCPLGCSAIGGEIHESDCLMMEILKRTCTCGEWMLGWHSGHSPHPILPTGEESPCVEHKWTGHKNDDTPDGPGEYLEYCKICGGGNTED